MDDDQRSASQIPPEENEPILFLRVFRIEKYARMRIEQEQSNQAWSLI